MRKEEFKKYLSMFYEKGTVADQVSYCNKAEKVLGCDLEQVVHDFLKIADAQNQLSTQSSRVRKAFLDYVGFTYSPKSKGAVSKPGREPTVFAGGPIVRYYDDVPVAERDEALRRALETQYPAILRYAAKILPLFINNNTLPFIPVYLSKETPKHEYPARKNYIDRLKEKVAKEEDLTDEEWRILESGKIRSAVMGRFLGGEEPYIEIYYQHLSGGTQPARIAEAQNCLAHEYMHFLHYWYAIQQGASDPLKNKNLSEALADCFGVLFSVHTGVSEDRIVAEERYRSWKRRKYAGWPYAYAIYCFPKRHKNDLLDYSGCDITATENKLNHVFGLTKDSKIAYDALMH